MNQGHPVTTVVKLPPTCVRSVAISSATVRLAIALQLAGRWLSIPCVPLASSQVIRLRRRRSRPELLASRRCRVKTVGYSY